MEPTGKNKIIFTPLNPVNAGHLTGAVNTACPACPACPVAPADLSASGGWYWGALAVQNEKLIN